eukprot:TRINITY_DN8491_c0_g1_i1.p1 TRINITY_DN8491_c0_g1~~TRINITY_DN8491_c0_g1_i1.p1  ORF type:complete len:794 (-),score=217.02 TRINITY_DN8491_c0_g1_i1:2-2383(-)
MENGQQTQQPQQASSLSLEELQQRVPLSTINGQIKPTMLRKPTVFKTPTSTGTPIVSSSDREKFNISPTPIDLSFKENENPAHPSTPIAFPNFKNMPMTEHENETFPVMKRKLSVADEEEELNTSISKDRATTRRKVDVVETKKVVKKVASTKAAPSLASKASNFSTSLRSSGTLSSSSRLNKSMDQASSKPVAGVKKAATTKSKPAGSNSALNTSTSSASGGAKRPPWDLRGRLEDMENLTASLREQLKNNTLTVSSLNEQIVDRERKISAVDDVRVHLATDLEARAKDMEDANARNRELVQTVNNMRAQHQMETELNQGKIRQLQAQLDNATCQLTNCQVENDTLKGTNAGQLAQINRLQGQIKELTAKLEASDNLCQQRQATITQHEESIKKHLSTIEDLEEKSRSDETIRRQLHNQIQELKGNIRVFCRVRPGPPVNPENEECQLSFPPNTENKALDIVFNTGNGVTGKSTQDKKMLFKFDKVFQPHTTQGQVFEEISQLVQSVLDGYNTCVFAYGMTGSGKTYTMEGPPHSLEQASLGLSLAGDDQRGMIPRTVEQIFLSTRHLESKGWKYEMESNFLEIYNESIRDLLCSKSIAADTKYDIKHDPNSGATSVTNMTVVKVTHPSQVYELLQTASKNRAVGKTNCNERSSRSHSVFQLILRGHNTITDERTNATLSLVDLAGRERIYQSGVTGDRLKETQAINKSLSSLADVICALANKDSHIPYRNSKLTYLLQSSLGGNSKTLMFVNISPEPKDLNESLSSLRFATKVNACEIGTARKGGKVDLKS